MDLMAKGHPDPARKVRYPCSLSLSIHTLSGSLV